MGSLGGIRREALGRRGAAEARHIVAGQNV